MGCFKRGNVWYIRYTIPATVTGTTATRKADLLTIAEILGHKDLRMTKRYAHISPAHKKAAVATLEQAYRVPSVTMQDETPEPAPSVPCTAVAAETAAGTANGVPVLPKS